MNYGEVESLLKVDERDQKAIKLKREIADLPGELERHKLQAKATAARVTACHEEQKRMQREIDKIDLDTRANNEQVVKYQVQQNTVKTNEEYSALKRQIEALKKANGDLEDKALALYERLDALKAEEAAAKAALKADEQKLKAEEGEVAKEVGALEQELAAILAERSAAEAKVGAPNIALYRRILEKHGNRALAAVRGRNCQGCFLEVPAQSLSTLLSGKEIVLCKYCSRILYLENDYRALSRTSYSVSEKDRDDTSKDGNW